MSSRTPHAACEGAALVPARRQKERTYRELVNGRCCRLVVLARDVVGRWSDEAVEFIRLLAEAKSRSAPRLVRASALAAYRSRWSAMPLSVRSRVLYWSSRLPRRSAWMERRRLSKMCSRMIGGWLHRA